VRYDEAEKRQLLGKLEELLQVAGTMTAFDALGLRKLTRAELRGLEYRVRQSIADAFKQGGDQCENLQR
jgi:hypothetical protein